MGLLWSIKWKLSVLHRKLDFKFYHIWWSYPRCAVCKHPLADHVTYTEAPSRFGVCTNPECIEEDCSTPCDSWNVPLERKCEVCKTKIIGKDYVISLGTYPNTFYFHTQCAHKSQSEDEF